MMRSQYEIADKFVLSRCMDKQLPATSCRRDHFPWQRTSPSYQTYTGTYGSILTVWLMRTARRACLKLFLDDDRRWDDNNTTVMRSRPSGWVQKKSPASVSEKNIHENIVAIWYVQLSGPTMRMVPVRRAASHGAASVSRLNTPAMPHAKASVSEMQS
jgi:hypothetical protein